MLALLDLRLLLAELVLIGLLWVGSTVMNRSGAVRVMEVAGFDGVPGDVERRIRRRLAPFAGTFLGTTDLGQITLTCKRAAPWAIVPAILLFPVGLLFFLVRDDLVLTFTVEPDGERSRVLIEGRTERRINDKLSRVFWDG